MLRCIRVCPPTAFIFALLIATKPPIYEFYAYHAGLHLSQMSALQKTCFIGTIDAVHTEAFVQLVDIAIQTQNFQVESLAAFFDRQGAISNFDKRLDGDTQPLMLFQYLKNRCLKLSLQLGDAVSSRKRALSASCPTALDPDTLQVIKAVTSYSIGNSLTCALEDVGKTRE